MGGGDAFNLALKELQSGGRVAPPGALRAPILHLVGLEAVGVAGGKRKDCKEEERRGLSSSTRSRIGERIGRKHTDGDQEQHKTEGH
ncbi:MAG: hypothetical protein ACYC2H_03135 [Thermoplasmatota archaeon]